MKGIHQEPVSWTRSRLPVIGVGGGRTVEGGFSARWITDGRGETVRKAIIVFREAKPCHGDQAMVAVRRGDMLHTAWGTGELSSCNPDANITSYRVLSVRGDQVLMKDLGGYQGRGIPAGVKAGTDTVDNRDGSLFVASGNRSDEEIIAELRRILEVEE